MRECVRTDKFELLVADRGAVGVHFAQVNSVSFGRVPRHRIGRIDRGLGGGLVEEPISAIVWIAGIVVASKGILAEAAVDGVRLGPSGQGVSTFAAIQCKGRVGHDRPRGINEARRSNLPSVNGQTAATLDAEVRNADVEAPVSGKMDRLDT